MRILLDECLPVPMRNILTSHQCVTVEDRGWKGIKNGELLAQAEVLPLSTVGTTDVNI
jgi:hypothetical protein